MSGELCAERFDRHLAAERSRRRTFSISPQKIPENYKKMSLE
jgi:hypothetical protein